jgi:hypothetical protein
MWRKAQVEHALGSHNPFVLNDLIPENIRNEIISPFVRLLHTDILEHQSDDIILWRSGILCISLPSEPVFTAIVLATMTMYYLFNLRG